MNCNRGVLGVVSVVAVSSWECLTIGAALMQLGGMLINLGPAGVCHIAINSTVE